VQERRVNALSVGPVGQVDCHSLETGLVCFALVILQL
jgi:hypothetical protein